MPRKLKPKIEKIFQDDVSNYVIEPNQTQVKDIETIEEKPKFDKKKSRAKKISKTKEDNPIEDINDISGKKIEKEEISNTKTNNFAKDIANKDISRKKIEQEKTSQEIDEKSNDKTFNDINYDKTSQKEKYTLIICEKPQAAMKLAYALADKSPIKRNWFGVPYWHINHEDKNYVIGSAVGHLFGLRQKSTSKEWPSFDLEWQPTQVSYAYKYIRALQEIAKKASDFIVACDYDVEGELIGFNVLRFICKSQEARRMKFSTLTKYDLIRSFSELLEHIDYGQAYAGETRHFLDWIYGINLSRALMQAIKQAGAFRIMSIGRVQGPTLALIVAREREILAFKPQPYWQVFLIVQDNKDQKIEVKFPQNIFSEKEAEKFLKLKGKKGQAETTTQIQELRPFPPFDLTALQVESYKFFGFSPAQTLAIAQRLYLAGLISYPRTSSQKLPPAIGYKRILSNLEQAYPKLFKFLKETREYPVQGGKTDPAHPAIFPTGEQGKLSFEEKRVYDLIVKRFLACFAQDAKLENKKIKVTVAGKEFFAEAKKILDRGWLNIYPYRIQEQELLDINGEILVKEARTEQKMTEPPRRYSPASIILELEKRKLGTKSTRASIIDTLYKRGYISGPQIQATQLGLATTEVLEKNCPLILDENLTRSFEEEMDKIVDEKTKEEMVKQEAKILEEVKQVILKIAQEFKIHEKAIGQALLEATKEQEQKQRETNKLFVCPECKKGMLVMLRSRKGKRFAACDNESCKKTFALPQFGLIKVSDRKCEKCNQQMLVLIKKSRLPWYFCMNPSCWLKPASETETKVKIDEKVENKTEVKKEKIKKTRKKKENT